MRVIFHMFYLLIFLNRPRSRRDASIRTPRVGSDLDLASRDHPAPPPTAVSRVASRARPRRADSRLLLRRRSEARDPLKRGITDHPKQPEHGHAAPPRGASRVSHRRHRVHVRRRPLRARDDLFRDLSEHGDSHETRARVVTVEDRDRSSVPKVDVSRARARTREEGIRDDVERRRA